MMKREGGQRPISPVTLVIVAVGLIVTGFLWVALPSKLPLTLEKLISPWQSSTMEVPQTGGALPLDEEALVEPGVPPLNTVPSKGRNPFQAPPVVKTLREPPADDGTGKRIPLGPPESDLWERQPIWQGLLRTTKGDQLVIVRYAAKTHFLRRGDLLPESSYRLTEIGPDYILFSSPGKQLKLARERKGI